MMAFKDFKNISQVLKKYNIKYQDESFLPIQEVEVPQHFLDEIQFSIEHLNAFGSEASRCENIIYPILREAFKQFADRLALWSHEVIRDDEDLRGAPDYLISTKSELGKKVIGLPLLIVSEAKRNDFEQGWGRCLTEMAAAQKINGQELLPLYGIVTDGELWQFGKLVQDVFTKDKSRLTIPDLPKIFGAVLWLLEEVSANQTSSAA